MMHRWQFALFGVLLVLGTLNREMTGILLLLSWLVLYGWRNWRMSLVYIVLVASTIFGLRVFIGAEPTKYTIAYMWAYNLDEWELSSAVLNHVLLLPMWILIWVNRRAMPQNYYRLLLIMIPYIFLLVILASWREIRLVIPIALLVLPMTRLEFD